MRSDVKAVVLSGGKSERIGDNKSFLSIESSFLLDVVVRRLRLVFSDIYIVTNRPSIYEGLNAICLADIFTEKGPLGGIYTALELIDANYIFVFACDMPFLNTQLITFMMEKIDKRYDVIVPLSDKKAEPLHAIYSRSLKDKIRDSVIKNRLSVNSFLNRCSTLTVNSEEIKTFGSNVFFNINTAEDYKKALDIVEYGAKN